VYESDRISDVVGYESDSEALRRNRISGVVGFESDSEALRRNRISGVVGYGCDTCGEVCDRIWWVKVGDLMLK